MTELLNAIVRIRHQFKTLFRAEFIFVKKSFLVNYFQKQYLKFPARLRFSKKQETEQETRKWIPCPTSTEESRENLVEGLMKIIQIRAFSKRSYKNNEACRRWLKMICCTFLEVSVKLYCIYSTVQARRQGGCDGSASTPPSPRVPEVHFFVDQRLKQSEFRVLFYPNSLIVQ